MKNNYKIGKGIGTALAVGLASYLTFKGADSFFRWNYNQTIKKLEKESSEAIKLSEYGASVYEEAKKDSSIINNTIEQLLNDQFIGNRNKEFISNRLENIRTDLKKHRLLF
ncbi:MAG: hypothetical protein AABW65_03385 [Nanoarchaeota archaeon]